ncbi:PEP-CTERM sorting domain-containing protein [Poriferisphaera sp. WC338]|uniref:PEP-CTERM sorting domain-containing protein n=1 Tax=Poriferisphaera sp. WC338 TaxID=3425129 RepID=UPI003D81B5BE
MKPLFVLATVSIISLPTTWANADVATFKVGETNTFTGTTYEMDTTNDGGIVLGNTWRMLSMGDDWNQASVGSTSNVSYDQWGSFDGGVRAPMMRFDLSSMAANYSSISGGTLDITLYDRQASSPAFMFDVVAMNAANSGWTFTDQVVEQPWNADVTTGAYKRSNNASPYVEWSNSGGWGGMESSEYTALNIIDTKVNGVSTQLNKRATDASGQYIDDGSGGHVWEATNNLFSPSDNVADGNPLRAMTYTIELSAELIEQWIANPENAGFMIIATEVIKDADYNYPPAGNPAALGMLNDSNINFRPSITIDYAAVPEPASLALFGIGGILLARRKRA